jgi:hypothetical protein
VVSSDIDVKITLTSWQLEMNEYKAIVVQIEQYWIQMKDVHPLLPTSSGLRQ